MWTEKLSSHKAAAYGSNLERCKKTGQRMLITTCHMQFFLKITLVTLGLVLKISTTQQLKSSCRQTQFWEKGGLNN